MFQTPNTVTAQPSSRRRPRLSPSSTPLRSPVVKRHPNAPVTLQGWLHKQGSEGLMLWKKRWFVLSDYILFYYKGKEIRSLYFSDIFIVDCGRGGGFTTCEEVDLQNILNANFALFLGSCHPILAEISKWS
ncbi:hypothetical protein WDU94_011650 [Cyamophila willieti]